MSERNVFISYDHLLFMQDFMNTNKHKHTMKHLTIATEGYMKCRLGNDDVNAYGYILKENVEHERYGQTSTADKMALLIEPSSRLSKEMDKVLGEDDYMLLSKDKVRKIVEIWKSGMTKEQGLDNYNEVMKEIFKVCGLERNEVTSIDKRISLALDMINESDIITDTLIEDITNKIYLSKSRFLHLFKDNIGISFKDFMLTKKFIKTWIYLGRGESITDACIHGGFFDSAHYTHFMSQCFGLTTKDELKILNSIYVVDKF